MKKNEVSPAFLQLLVRVYNQTIQSYYFFPDVILCGQQRLEREEFEQLTSLGFIHPYHTDSFGRLYRLTPEAETLLHEGLQLRRHRQRIKALSQPTLFAFTETC